MRVFLFPGQGSQEVGMAADLFKSDPFFRELAALASECARKDLEKICLRGPELQLRQSRYLQPLLVCVALGYYRQATVRGLWPDLVLGHSLGELSALAAAEVLTPEEAVRFAAKRGELMDEAALMAPGGMLAVTTTHRDEVLPWLQRTWPDQSVVLANDNAPQQLVLSGSSSALAACAQELTRLQWGRTRQLPVAGPWHSPYMQSARNGFAAWSSSRSFRPATRPILCNVNAELVTNPQILHQNITDILAQPVRWRECMDQVQRMQPQALYEIGPGRILAGLARANGLKNEIPVFAVNNLRGVQLAVDTPLTG